jgi:hypothetical protein
MGGYIEIPDGWEVLDEDGPGPFVTSLRLRDPTGAEVSWRSRAHRKGGARPAPDVAVGKPRVWWRPRERSWWMAVLFSIGSLCFTVAALASQWSPDPHPWVDITFFVGSIFFTSASYLQYSETINAPHRLAHGTRRRRLRVATWEPHRIDWLAALVQFVGTLAFNLSTFAALKHGLTTSQSNRRVWAPDAFGSICFLLSSELAYAEVCHRWVCLRDRSLSWWIAAGNMLGSIAFGLAAVGSLIEPGSGEAVSARIANAGTAFGGLCFLLAALALMPEAARARSAPAMAGHAA